MKDLQAATERICELKGAIVAIDAVLLALSRAMPHDIRLAWWRNLGSIAEVAGSVLMSAPVSDTVLEAFEHDVQRWRRALQSDLFPTGPGALPLHGLPSSAAR